MTGSSGPATHGGNGAHAPGTHAGGDDHHAADRRPAYGQHADRLRRRPADRPAHAALRPGPRAAPEGRLDVDVAAAGRRRRQLRRVHRLFHRLRPAGASRLDRTQQPVVHSHDATALGILRVSRRCRRQQNQRGSAEGENNNS